MNKRKTLTDILLNSDRESLTSLWNTTAAAAEFAPLPKGEYIFRILTGELFTSKNNKPGYKLTLEVAEGDFEGRRAWCDLWLTKPALPMTKRDLAKIGVKDLEQLERPLPAGILIKGKLALRTDDDGNQNNRLVRFEFVGIEPGDAFEPKDEDAAAPEKDGEQGKPETGKPAPDASFAFGANVAPSANGDRKPQEATP
jgi:hypothetical protein